MLIELVGPPGSGKSTMLPGLADSLRKDGCDPELVDWRGDLLGRSVRHIPADLAALALSPRLLVHLASWLPQGAEAARQLLQVARRHHELRRLTPGRLTIIDEGPIQRAVWAATWLRRDAVKLARCVALPDAVFRVRLDPPTSWDRIVVRGDTNPSILTLGYSRGLDVLARFDECTDQFLGAADVLVLEDAKALARTAQAGL